MLATLAWLFRRAACYTITSKRVLFQFGVALPITMNIPLCRITNAALKTYRGGRGDIPLRVSDDKRVSYLLLWPHIRPWGLRAPEPMLVRYRTRQMSRRSWGKRWRDNPARPRSRWRNRRIAISCRIPSRIRQTPWQPETEKTS